MDISILIIALLVLGITGLLAAVCLFFVAQKFKVEENPKIDLVQEVLPGANCGGCGFAGCRSLAEACVKAENLDGLLCPVGGSPTMAKVGEILGVSVFAAEPKVAVVRCNGTCSVRPKTSEYDGAKSCRIMHNLYIGETACAFGCLGCGDCVEACQFGAIRMNPQTDLPEVDEEKCTSCGACVKACPRNIIELRKKGPKNRRMVVLCVNKDKGASARKACLSACIGCGKCQKECPFEAIIVENNLAYIDFEKCRLCRKCETACPTGAIHAINFSPRKPAQPTPAIEEKMIVQPMTEALTTQEEKTEPIMVQPVEAEVKVSIPNEDIAAPVIESTVSVTLESEADTVVISVVKPTVMEPQKESENLQVEEVIKEPATKVTEQSIKTRRMAKNKHKESAPDEIVFPNEEEEHK